MFGSIYLTEDMGLPHEWHIVRIYLAKIHLGPKGNEKK